MRRMSLTACLAIAVVSSLLGQTAAQGARLGPHPRPDYFVIHDGSYYRRSTAPMTWNLIPPPGTASQTVNRNHSITLEIADAEHYADDGFYLEAGRLAEINSIVVTGADVDPYFALNLWFDSNDDGEFFVWTADVSSDVLVQLGGDQYGLGPHDDGGTLRVDDDTTFDMQGVQNGGESYTLAQLKAGEADEIDGDTLVAAWVGICCGGSAGSPGDQSATIQSLKVR